MRLGAARKKKQAGTKTGEAARWKLPGAWRAGTVTLEDPRNVPGGYRDSTRLGSKHIKQNTNIWGGHNLCAKEASFTHLLAAFVEFITSLALREPN